MRILIIGAGGQVGRFLNHALAPRHETVGTVMHSDTALGTVLDIRDPGKIRTELRRIRPEHVILTAAMTNVDDCESHPDEARAVNRTAPEYIARVCRELGAGLTFFSSDYVFDGNAGPYAETDVPAPQSVYGRTKWEGEQAVSGLLPDALILRTTVVYSYLPGSKNFFMQTLEKIQQGRIAAVPNDQIGNPTQAQNLAEAAGELIEQKAAGIFHLTGTTRISRYAFAQKIVQALGADPGLIRPVATSELQQAAPRPLQGGVKTDKAQARLQQHPLWDLETGLRHTLALVRAERPIK